ncbi:hypothetical protein AWZ03_014312 [Drosophila navojoa]|uniref:FCP1 homology domain-containing protein n=1 Tax=Drosophila navojoa TaxID=7232 RepID=A0A484ASB0_DRONA|nr:CTD nuclear envelope phosphatase 1A [Drosophila navojoa]TDG39268.1 hypothetical protein AWZ03_014312 [Drosophila navojoa]
MMLELPEQPKSSLSPINTESNSPKVQAAQAAEEPSAELVNIVSCETASSSLGSCERIQRIRWADWIARIISWTDELGHYVRQFLAYVAAKFRSVFFPGDSFIYREPPLSNESRIQLETVPRKTLILDLDETLVHSCYLDPDTHDVVGCTFVPATAVPDYILNIPILANLGPVEFQVFKRPYVDLFLDLVSKWYDVVIYTASLQAYASIVIDKLDAGRGILQRRYYRQHCVNTSSLVSKNLFVVNRDLNSVLIIDNSPSAYRDFPENALPIKSYIYDPNDRELLNLLPFLDALRFTKDVRSILRRRELTSLINSE